MESAVGAPAPPRPPRAAERTQRAQGCDRSAYVRYPHSPQNVGISSEGFAARCPKKALQESEIRASSRPTLPVGDTGLELASGPWVRSDSLVLLRFGALRSAQGRSNCYQNCYQGSCQVAAVGNDRSHASRSSNSDVSIARLATPASCRMRQQRGAELCLSGEQGRHCGHWQPRPPGSVACTPSPQHPSRTSAARVRYGAF